MLSAAVMGGWSELAAAALAVAGVWHALTHELDQLPGLQQSLRLRAAANALSVHKHSRYLQRTMLYPLLAPARNGFNGGRGAGTAF